MGVQKGLERDRSLEAFEERRAYLYGGFPRGNVLFLEFDERRKKPDIAKPTRKPFLLEPSKGEENRLDGDRKYKRRGVAADDA